MRREDEILRTRPNSWEAYDIRRRRKLPGALPREEDIVRAVLRERPAGPWTEEEIRSINKARTEGTLPSRSAR